MISKKMSEIKHEDFSKQCNYIQFTSINKARMAFRIRCQMVKNIPGNFKNKYRCNKKTETSDDNDDEGLICSCCRKEIMTQAHCVVCPAWVKLRDGLDMDSIEGLVIFFQNLIEEREQHK